MGRILGSIVNGTGNTLRELGIYMAGRGVVTTAAILAGLASNAFLGAAITVPSLLVILSAGVTLGAVMRVRDMQLSQDNMANIYREEIASQLGIAPQQVTRGHVHLLAFGDEKRGIVPNPILRDQVEREWKKAWLGFGASLVSAAVGFGLISVGMHEQLLNAVPEAIPHWLFGTGAGLVTGLTGLVVHNGLDLTLQNATSLGRYTLHDRIAQIDRSLNRGRQISKEQVFGLYIAADPRLDMAVQRHFGKHYDALPLEQKDAVLANIGTAQEMQAIADDLNARRISAGALAFMVAGQGSVQRQGIDGVGGVAMPQAPSLQQEPPAIRTDFVGRTGRASVPQLSHVEREEVRRMNRELLEASR